MTPRLFASFLTLTTLALSSESLAATAELVLTSRNTLTMESTRPSPAQHLAVAISGETITWVGEPAVAHSHIGPNTKVIDLGDAALLPGLIDAHGHLTFTALTIDLANVASPPVGPVNTMADLQATLTAYIAERQIPTDAWVIGMGYDDSLISEQRHPNRDDLDAVSTDHAIALLHVSGHLTAANSKALARAGITSDTPDPNGGIIRRRPGSSEPDGVLEETATYPLRRFMLTPSNDPIANLEKALASYAAFGITTVQDGATAPEGVALLEAAARSDRLSLDVIAYPAVRTPELMLDAYPYGEYQGRLKVGGVKLMLDGSPQGKTAYLSKPYHVPPPGQSADYRGYPTIPPAEASRRIGMFLDAGIPMLIHANGDAAADMLIDGVEAGDHRRDHRTVMIHAQTVREDQLTRMKQLGIIPSYFSAHTFYWGDWHRDSVLGPERGKRISPTASTLARGMTFTVHNDTPIVPADMLRLLWATTNRRTRSNQQLGPDQRIPTYDALRAMTSMAAAQHFEEHLKGTISAGKLADLVVLSQDPTAVDAADLLALKVLRTYARGKLVHAL